METYQAKYKITIHNYWTNTTINTYDVRIAANHMMYKSWRPPSSSHESIILSIDSIKYDVEPQRFRDPLSRSSTFDAVHKKIIDDIVYCLDLHEALYINQ